MVKRINNNNNRKRNNRGRRRGRQGNNGNGKMHQLQLFKKVPLMQKELTRQITLSVPVYANLFAATPAASYSLNSSPLLAPILYYNVLGNLATETEFLRLTADYNFFRFSKIGYRINCTFMPGRILNDAPDLYFNSQVLNSITGLTKEGNAKADTAFPVKLNNIGSQAAYFESSLPGVIQGVSGYVFGSNVWINTNSTAWTSASIYMTVGSLLDPTFDSSIAVNTSVRVAAVEILFDLCFAGPVLQ